MNVSVRTPNAGKLGFEFARHAEKITPLAATVVTRMAMRLLVDIKQEASHRPGPQIERTPPITYVDTWAIEYRFDLLGPAAEVWTWSPYGRRLNEGFVGTDSRGRKYAQPPFPHVDGPVDRIEAPFVEAMADAADLGRNL